MISPTPERTWLGLGLGLGSALGLGPRLGLGLGSGVGLGLGLAGTHVRGLEGPEEVGVDEGVQRLLLGLLRLLHHGGVALVPSELDLELAHAKQETDSELTAQD